MIANRFSVVTARIRALCCRKMSVCPFVHLPVCVTHASLVRKRLNMSSILTVSIGTSFRRESPAPRGRRMRRGYDKNTIFDQHLASKIILDTCCGMRISSGFYHSPKSRVKIGLTPLSEASSSPHFPQMPSKYILAKCRCQNWKCTMKIDVTTSRIVSNKFVLHGIQRKQWSRPKWNIGALQNQYNRPTLNTQTRKIMYFPLFSLGADWAHQV